jgi:isoleucyl-tRNA synthetase
MCRKCLAICDIVNSTDRLLCQTHTHTHTHTHTLSLSLSLCGSLYQRDGKKMSKRLKNYPDPMDVVSDYGADALRYACSDTRCLSRLCTRAVVLTLCSISPLYSMYLLNSPAVHGEDLRFQQQGVRDIIRDVLLPWFNAYRFLVQSTLQYQEVFWSSRY